MKKVKLILTASLFSLGTIALMTSCNPDPVECEVGKEGEKCETLSRDKFLGNWSGRDICVFAAETNVNMEISEASSNEISVLVTNPGGFGGTIKITGVITATNKLTFTNQNVGNNINLNGTMTISGNDLTFQYEVVGEVDSDTCTGTYTRQ